MIDTASFPLVPTPMFSALADLNYETDVQQRLKLVLSQPFLLIDVGDYGHGYETIPLPPQLAQLAAEYERRGERRYPINLDLPPPHYHVPADLTGILINKLDELRLNGFAYWAQNLRTVTGPRGCVNASRGELVTFAQTPQPFRAVLATKQKTSSPKGNTRPGRIFQRWTVEGKFVADEPTAGIKTDIVYTEKGKDTLVFDSLEPVDGGVLNTRDFHVHFTTLGRTTLPAQYRGKRLAYRASQVGTASLLAPGVPDETDIKPLSASAPVRRIVAMATLHPHICGKVIA